MNNQDIKKIHHIGIAVKDIKKAQNLFNIIFNVKISESEIEEVDLQKVKVAFVNTPSCMFELIQATSAHSPLFPIVEHPILSFIRKRGEGLHHICFQVKDIDNSILEFEKSGIRLLNKDPIKGAGGNTVYFLNPNDCNGLLIELIQ